MMSDQKEAHVIYKTLRLFRDIAGVVAPPPVLTVSQWADLYRRLSAESAICRSSSRTNVGIIILPSINPVCKISRIRPSIITLVSSILGLPAASGSSGTGAVVSNTSCSLRTFTSSFFRLATRMPRIPNRKFNSTTMNVPTAPNPRNASPIRFASTSPIKPPKIENASSFRFIFVSRSSICDSFLISISATGEEIMK